MPTALAVWTARDPAGLRVAAPDMPPAPAPRPRRTSPAAAGRPRDLRMLQVTGRLVQRVTVTALTLAFLVLAALPAVQHKALIVTSGSMEPLLSAGDAAIIHLVPAEDLTAGDVITYSGYGSDQLTTHRIVRPVQLDSGLHFQTKGDANAAPDPDLAPAAGVVGRYVVGLPQAGRVLLFIAQPRGRLLVVGLPALATLAAEVRFLLTRCRRSGTDRRGLAATAAGILVVGVAAAAGVYMASGALLTDVDAIGDNTFTTSDAFPA